MSTGTSFFPLQALLTLVSFQTCGTKSSKILTKSEFFSFRFWIFNELASMNDSFIAIQKCYFRIDFDYKAHFKTVPAVRLNICKILVI